VSAGIIYNCCVVIVTCISVLLRRTHTVINVLFTLLRLSSFRFIISHCVTSMVDIHSNVRLKTVIRLYRVLILELTSSFSTAILLALSQP